MFLIESIAQAWHSLRGHKLRTGLTMFGIVWGIASMIILVGMGNASEQLFNKEFKKIGKKMIIVWAGRSSSGLSGTKQDKARAAYFAICLGQAERLRTERAAEWKQALNALKGYPGLVKKMFEAPAHTGEQISAQASAAGLKKPE